MPFKNRSEAGQKLAAALNAYKEQNPTVLALPRGGVPVAAEVAAALDAPLDLILVRKVGVPFQPELAMGAVVDGSAPIVVRNEDIIRYTRIGEDEFQAVCDRELAEIERRRERYLGQRPRVEIAGRTAIVIDDGIATGATVRAALRAIRARNPRKLVLAVPVAPRRPTMLSASKIMSFSAPSVSTMPISARSPTARLSISLRAFRSAIRLSSHCPPNNKGFGNYL
jgi:putative phosphoribosyl transferase